MIAPETKYALNGSVNIAYQTFGDGPIDIVLVPGWISNMEVFWEEPRVARFFQRLGSFARVILFDKRGTGLSDRITDTPMLEERMDDVRAVMDVVGCSRAVLLGYSEGGPMCALFAATHPDRTQALVMIGSYARLLYAEDYPWGRTAEEQEKFLSAISRDWGGPLDIEMRIPSIAKEEQGRNWWGKVLRNGASPRTALALTRMNGEIDVRHILPSVNVPTLIIHATGDKAIRVGAGRYLAENIPNAKLVELDTDDHVPFFERSNEILSAVEQFLTGKQVDVDVDRAVRTVLFTDIVDSTKTASNIGDERWKDMLELHNNTVRGQLAIHRGKEENYTGDGFFATFDGPARAIKCAEAIREAVKALGIEVRIGIHTGECELHGETVAGLAVHIGARVSAKAGANQILASQTVKDLVAGSGINFDEFGTFTLKGVPDEWCLYLVA